MLLLAALDAVGAGGEFSVPCACSFFLIVDIYVGIERGIQCYAGEVGAEGYLLYMLAVVGGENYAAFTLVVVL